MIKNLIKIAVILAIGAIIFVGVQKYMNQKVLSVKIQRHHTNINAVLE